jgi:outer membrane lipoprotein-sorting protein
MRTLLTTTIVALVLSLCLSTTLKHDLACAAANPPKGNPTPADAARDGAQFVDQMFRAANGLKDYTCDSELDTFKVDQTKKSKCKFFWKDDQVRIEVTGGGYRDGTVLIKQKDGRVTAVGGFFLGHIRMNLDPDSRMLILPNGVNCLKTDFPTILTEMKDSLAHGYTARVTPTPIMSNDVGTNVYVLEILDPKAQNSVSRRIFVTPDQRLPLRWDMLQDGKITSSAWFKGVRTNNGLSQQLFQL